MNPNKALWEKGDFTRIAELLQRELEALFTSQDQSTKPGATSIPATYLRVTVEV
jgi:hypothetical protein